MRKRSFFTLSAVVLPEVFGWGVVYALLPFLALDLGATPLVVGLLIAVFPVCQSISAPIIGKLSDRFGRKPLLIFSQASTIISFLILAYSNSLLLVLISRVIHGLFGSTTTVVIAYITDISKGKKRLKYFTYNHGVRSIGYAIGPIIGGALAEISYTTSLLVAAVTSSISLLITLLFVKRTIIVKKKIRFKREDFSPLMDLVNGFRKKRLRKNLIQFFLLAFVMALITSNLGLYVKYQLDLGPLETGTALMILGVLAIIYQFFIQPRILSGFKVRVLKIVGLSITVLSTLLIYFVNSVYSLYIVALLVGIGIILARPIVTDQLCEKVSKEEQGLVSGLMGSLTNISSIIGPIIGGYVIMKFYPGLLGPIASVMALLGLLYGLRNGR